MWWLERSDLLKRGQSNAHQLGAYPRTANLWLKDKLNDKEVKRSYRSPLAFTLKPILRPDNKPLRPDLRIPIEQVRAYDSDEEERPVKFNAPSSWRERLRAVFPGDSKKYRLEKEEVVVVEEKELSPAEKESILLEQEGFVAKKRTRWKDVLASLEGKPDQGKPDSGKTPGWIKKSLVSKPPGRADGLKAPVSEIGSKLNRKSAGLKLWHEQMTDLEGKTMTGILLRQAHEEESPTAAELALCKPLLTFLRVEVLPQYSVAPRILPEDQKNDLEKGGHGTYRQQIVDKNVLVESLRRTEDPSERHLEAAAVLTLAVLYDNGQDYTKAVENYERFIDICRETGDTKAEAMACNFVACSLQEDQDKKLKADKVESVGSMGELKLSTEATMQFEKALEYHERHAKIADLEGKYVAYTNAGLLQSALGRWTEAARSHRKALQCATYMRRPEQQSVAVGNLACLLLRRKKFGAATLCTKRYLQICEGLQYMQGKARGHYMLGHICSNQQKFYDAAEEFRTCVKLAKTLKMRELEFSAKVLIGVVKGKLEHAKSKAPEYACFGYRE